MGQKIQSKEVATPREIFGSPDLESTLKEIKKYNRKLINLNYFKPNKDGITDNKNIINKASELANKENKILYIPEGNYYISDNVIFKTSVICEGNLITDKDTTEKMIKIQRNENSISIDPTTLSNLNKGSTKINGLENYNNYTLNLESEEILIYRNQGDGSSYYTKNDNCKIIDNLGHIQPQLDVNYTDLSKLNVELYPNEKTIFIEGLNIISNTDTETNRVLLNIERDNVIFNNLNINHNGNGNIGYAININKSNNINFYNYNANNFKYSGLGYGINILKSSNINIINSNITNCRHSISGRHAKQVLINGGSYSAIDNHWGRDFVIKNSNIQSNTDSFIYYSGANITIKDNKFNGEANHLLTIRNDTPELDGKINIKNNKIQTKADFFRYIAYTSLTPNLYEFNFNKNPILNPRLVNITNNDLKLPDDKWFSFLQFGQRSYNQTIWGIINIKNNTHPSNTFCRGIQINKDTDYFISDNYTPKNTIINIENIDFNYHNSVDLTSDDISIILKDLSDTQSNINNYGFEINIFNSKNISINVDNSVLQKGILNNCTLYYQFKRINSGITSLMDNSFIRFKNCDFNIGDNNMDFATYYWLEFINNIFRGTLNTYSLKETDLTTQSLISMMNRSVGTISNYPTLDGITNNL